METKKKIKNAFTIVELLTVISIIALIIGLLVPALNQVNRIAKDTKQKAQFHAITTGLEMFKTEMGELPESNYSTTPPNGNNGICGAHKLAEALVGRDLQGYDPLSKVDNPGYSDSTYDVYPYGVDGTDTDYEDSLDRRKGPYLSVDNASAFDLDQLYPNGTGNAYAGASTGNSAPVITDIYAARRISVGNKTVSAGTPVLYYKANVAERYNDRKVNSNTYPTIYNIYDNDELVKLGTVKDSNVKHKIATDNTEVNAKEIFYNMIANDVASANITDNDLSRPYKPDSFILLSAGFDGVFGTNDDITNFEE